MNINWRIRLKNPVFWTGLIGVLGTFAVGIAQLFGIDLTQEAGEWTGALSALVTAVFGVLSASPPTRPRPASATASPPSGAARSSRTQASG